MVDALLRLPEVRRRVGLSRSQIYLLVSRGYFPPPVKISLRAVGWPSVAIDAWIKERIASGRSQ